MHSTNHSSPTLNADRFERQQAIVPHDKLAEQSATIIGVGAVGRQVALQLAALGLPRFQLIDFDLVELINVTTQGYRSEEIGQSKVCATAAAIRQIDPATTVEVISDRYRRKHVVAPVIFCCVDSISSRAAIWRAVGSQSAFWADGRLAGETLRTLAVTGTAARERYAASLFPQADAHAGSCHARGTIYLAAICAGLLVHQFCRWLRGLATEPDILLDLLASEIVVNP